MAARDNRPVLTMEDLNEALMKITAGPAKKSRVQTRKDLKETAIHEAGHAVAMFHLATHDPVRYITIIPRGQSLGATWYLPKDDSSNLTRNEMYEQIVGLLGGRVAEALFLGDISTGASSDIDRATKLAKDMVARYGMCEKLGTVSALNELEEKIEEIVKDIYIGVSHEGYSVEYELPSQAKANIIDVTEDLIQEGMIGLFRAIKDYDSGRDASFFTFADLCISRKTREAKCQQITEL